MACCNPFGFYTFTVENEPTKPAAVKIEKAATPKTPSDPVFYRDSLGDRLAVRSVCADEDTVTYIGKDGGKSGWDFYRSVSHRLTPLATGDRVTIAL
jgi:hypothetical protein